MCVYIPIRHSRKRRNNQSVTHIVLLLFLFSLGLRAIEAKAKQDLYSVLNVPKTATEKEITKAYRKAALKYHPDKVAGPEREKAANTFKEIGNAYDILKDENKRKIYDQYGEEGLKEGFHPSFNGMGNGSGGNPFSDAQQFSSRTYSFGGPSAQGTDAFGIDLNDILQSFMMGNQQNARNPFSSFNGFANMSNAPERDKSRSHVKPVTKDFYCTLAELSNWNGCTKKLKVTMPIIDPFSGKKHNQEKIYEIKVEPGWRDGTKVSFKGTQDGVFPPITFVMKLRPHKFIQRKDDDLIYNCHVSSSQAEKGSKITVPLPNGEMLKVVTQPGEIKDNYKKRIPGKGMPVRGSTTQSRGDFWIQFSIQEEAMSSTQHQ